MKLRDHSYIRSRFAKYTERPTDGEPNRWIILIIRHKISRKSPAKILRIPIEYKLLILHICSNPHVLKTTNEELQGQIPVFVVKEVSFH
jgi:hypothetical protein